MVGSQKKRLILFAGAAALMLAVYFCAYFYCVSVEVAPSAKEPTLHLARPRYSPAPFSRPFAEGIFEPARVIDAAYLRPAKWQDRQLPRRR